MGILYVVVPVAVAIVLLALVAFRWAVRSGQLDDLDTPAVRMLHDDEPARGQSRRIEREEGESGAREVPSDGRADGELR